MKKELIRVISFVLLFFILLEGSSRLFFSNKKAADFENKFQDAYSFMDEPQNTIQIAGVGNSDLYSGFSPNDLWNDFGYTSTICASIRQTIQDSQYLLERVFENQSPQIVIIETDMLYGKNTQNTNHIKQSHKLTDFFDTMQPEFFERDVEHVFPIFRYHNIWKMSAKKGGKKLGYSTHGYRYNNKTVRLKHIEYMIPTDKCEPIKKINQNRMDMLIAYCQSKNAKVILVEMPSITSWNYERHNATADYANSKNVPFIDFNLLYEECGLSIETCFRDKGNHLNYMSAKAVTQYLGNYIEDHYAIDSLKNHESYQSWNQNYSAFVKDTRKK